MEEEGEEKEEFAQCDMRGTDGGVYEQLQRDGGQRHRQDMPEQPRDDGERHRQDRPEQQRDGGQLHH